MQLADECDATLHSGTKSGEFLRRVTAVAEEPEFPVRKGFREKPDHEFGELRHTAMSDYDAILLHFFDGLRRDVQQREYRQGKRTFESWKPYENTHGDPFVSEIERRERDGDAT